jgi:hypothetical protein
MMKRTLVLSKHEMVKAASDIVTLCNLLRKVPHDVNDYFWCDSVHWIHELFRVLDHYFSFMDEPKPSEWEGISRMWRRR